MKRNLQLIIIFLLIYCRGYSANTSANFSSSGCSLAGTASLLKDSICNQDTATLFLTGYIGAIQWQHFDGTNWINASGPGSTADTFSLVPGVTTQYRALVTETGCLPDSSNIITITVGIIAVPSPSGDSRCGYGQVNLQASGASDYNWYNVQNGGIALGTGPTFSPVVSSTTTYYVEALSGGGTASPLTTTYAAGNGFNGNMFDVEAINQVNISSFDCNCNPSTAIAEIWYRSGTYVGHELDSAGWIFVGSASVTSLGNGSGTPVPININVTIPAGQTFAFYFHFNGGVDYTNGTVVGAVAAQDANLIIREGAGGAYFNLVNNPRIWNGTVHYTAGCTSPRIPVVATVNFTDPVVLSAADTALCLGVSTTLSVTSNNSSYSYTWTPAIGLDTTIGDTVTATPIMPTMYYAVGDNGTCANIDSVFIDVGPISVAGAASMQVDTICENDTTSLTLSGSVGHIQWQSNTGAGWVNETAAGFDSSIYVVTPSVDIQYRAVLTSGGCNPDTSNILSLAVLHVVAPSVTDTAGCANDSIPLNASGTNVIWFADPDSGGYFAQGNNVTVYVIGDTTFYTASKGGSTDHVGPASNSIGNSNQSADDAYGIGFDVTRPCILEKVYVYPVGNDTLIINLRDVYFGPILRSISVVLTPSLAKVPVLLGWQLAPGVGYRLEIAGGSVPLKYNYSGATISYPYITGNSPLTITGSLDPFLDAFTQQYYYFYDFVVFEGCYSPRVPLHVVTSPPQPTIVQNGTTLTSSASTGNQWYWNGALIPGATNQTLIISQVGLYSVYVTVAGCTAIGTVNVTFVGMTELKNAGIQIYPNPVNDKINIHFENAMKDIAQVRLIEATGAVVYLRKDLKHIADLEINTSKLNAGSYLLELKTTDGIYRKTIIKQ